MTNHTKLQVTINLYHKMNTKIPMDA